MSLRNVQTIHVEHVSTEFGNFARFGRLRLLGLSCLQVFLCIIEG